MVIVSSTRLPVPELEDRHVVPLRDAVEKGRHRDGDPDNDGAAVFQGARRAGRSAAKHGIQQAQRRQQIPRRVQGQLENGKTIEALHLLREGEVGVYLPHRAIPHRDFDSGLRHVPIRRDALPPETHPVGSGLAFRGDGVVRSVVARHRFHGFMRHGGVVAEAGGGRGHTRELPGERPSVGPKREFGGSPAFARMERRHNLRVGK